MEAALLVTPAAIPARAAPTLVALFAQSDTTTLQVFALTLAQLAKQSFLPMAHVDAPVIVSPVIVRITPTAQHATISLCLSIQDNVFLHVQLEVTLALALALPALQDVTIAHRLAALPV